MKYYVICSDTITKDTLYYEKYTFSVSDELLSANVDIGRRGFEENGTIRQANGTGASKGNVRRNCI